MSPFDTTSSFKLNALYTILVFHYYAYRLNIKVIRNYFPHIVLA